MGIKFIAFVAVVWLGFVVFNKFRQSMNQNKQKPSSNKMLACHVCQTHVPENEAIVENGKVYCSKDCL